MRYIFRSFFTILGITCEWPGKGSMTDRWPEERIYHAGEVAVYYCATGWLSVEDNRPSRATTCTTAKTWTKTPISCYGEHQPKT